MTLFGFRWSTYRLTPILDDKNEFGLQMEQKIQRKVSLKLKANFKELVPNQTKYRIKYFQGLLVS